MNCPSCGRQNPASASRCAGCGALIGGRDSTYDDAPTMGPMTMPPVSTSGFGASTGVLGRGTRLGNRYEILSILGQGGMGTVYKAHDRELDRTVALKVIRPDLASRPPILERFKREILLASQVTHKNVLRIHDLGEAGDVKFISMNYVEGTDLASVLKNESPLPLERSLPLVRQIIEALQAAHEAGVVHRDLKPQNILIDAKGNAYIADFGISRSLIMGGTMTETGQVIGTIDYMSPEQARGETADHRADIYSLGVIMYEVFTGSLPFQGSNSLSVMMKRVHQDAPTIRQSRPQFPLWLSSIVSRAMKREPSERYQSVAEMLRDIDRQRASIAWKRLLGRRVLIAAAALVVLAAAGFGAVTFYKSMPAGPVAPVTSLALMPFRNGTGDAAFDWARAGLPEILRTDLMQSKALRVASEDRVEEILETLKVPAGQESREATLQKVASFTSAENVVTGSLIKVGEGFRVSATLRSVTSSSSLGPEISFTVEGDRAEKLFAMMDELATRMRDHLGASRGWGESDRGTTELTTSSIEALKLYSEGLALSRAGKHLEASKLLEAAVEKDPGFATAYALLAETYDRQGYSEKASGAADKAAEGLGKTSAAESARIRAVRARLANDLGAAEKAYKELCEISPNDSEAVYGLASLQEEKGDLETALASLKRALELDAKHPDALYALGRVLVKQGKPTEAITVLNDALAIHVESGNEEGRATVLNGLGNAYLRLSKYDEALKMYKESLEIRQRIGDKRGVRVALYNVARIHGVQGRYDEAFQVMRDALVISQEIGDQTGLAEGQQYLGDLYQEAGKPKEALAAYRESLGLMRESGDETMLPAVLSSMGYITAVLGNYEEAFVFHQQALEKRRQQGDKREIIRSLIDIGIVEQFLGRSGKSFDFYLEALSLSREIGERAYEGVLLYNMANIEEQRGEYGTALEHLQAAGAIADEVADPTQEAACQTYLGSTRLRVGDRGGAEKALKAAIDQARSIGNTPLLAEALTHEGERLAAGGNLGEAKKVLREAVDAARDSQDFRLILLARLKAAVTAGSATELEKILGEARSSGLKPLEGMCLLELARIRLGAGDSSAAFTRAEEALRAAKPQEQRDILFQAHHLAGVAAGAKGDSEGRLRHFQSALTMLEEMRRGLTGEVLASFIGRPETSAFARDAEKAFVAPAGAADAERLRVALTP